MTYRAPVRELAFCLTQVVGVQRLTDAGAFSDFDPDIMTAVLEAAGGFAEEVLAPLNRIGDQHGARYANGVVTTPPGFAEAYRAYAAGGWVGLDAEPEWGGQGMPKALALAAAETTHAACMAFGLNPMLTHGAVEALAAHGSAAQKALYLPKLVSGEWTGTMNLTEPHAGSDLSSLRTRADPDGDGRYRLTGQKIFITWGDHDVADNVVHLVLARLPDAPEGTRGISLFVAPKRLPGGERNALRVGGIEHKLGIHASPTCIMLFEGALAEMVGAPGQGLACMFTMMNSARLNVGMEGVAIAERARQGAFAYARERRQGNSAFTGERNAPIWDHPEVRRSLLSMRARVEAARAICLETAVNADLKTVAGEYEDREAARLREETLVPIAKAWSTDVGVAVASEALQLHGGMGYVEETGAAQHYRDARIAPIYEGTNAIQAIDLAGRKLGMAGGEGARALLADCRETAGSLCDGGLDRAGRRLSAAVDAAAAATDWLAERRGTPDALAGASAYLTLMGDVVGGRLLGRGALAAECGDDATQARLRRSLLTVFADEVLSLAPGRAIAATAGADALDVDADALG